MSLLRHLSYFFLPLPFATAAIAEERAIQVGYAQASAAGNTSRAMSTNAAALKWYFAHASVGANLIDGLTDLRAKDSTTFPLKTIFSSATPPANTEPGIIYEHNRGNPNWKAKLDQFEECVRNSWHAPKVDVVMNKLCYIDQLASAKYYLHSMTNLEASVPGTRLVYMTMPLTTDSDLNNFLRNAYNEKVRAWTRANGRVLFDLADIEAHDPKGRPCSFEYRGRTCQRLCDAYTNDGGHLNEQGRQLAANGLYALAAALAERRVEVAKAAIATK